MSNHRTCLLSSLSVLLAAAVGGNPAAAAEVCGDGVDNDSDGVADDGCYPTGVTGVCESPLSCMTTGAVAPVSGGLVHRMPADLTPTVPYGPGITFQRVYTSLYEPGYNFPSATDFKAPLGYQWQHNFMSWLEWSDGGGGPDTVVLHNTKGQDVHFTFDQTAGGYDYYTAQPGYHVDYLRQKTNAGQHWELRTLTGMVYEYDWSNPNDRGMLIEIADAAGNVVTVGYNNDGQVDTITDAVGHKEIRLEYFSTGTELLQYVKYYTVDGANDTLQVTVEYTYSSNKLSTVKIGSTTIQKYTYDTDGYLSLIEDGEDFDIAAFAYVDGNAGQVARLETGDGDIGYEYGVSGGSCDGGTYLFYHRGSATSCDADGDCASDEFCGGETGAGANSGTCYRVRRCLLFEGADEEDLVTAVSAEKRTVGAGVVSCTDCVGTEDYDWDTASGTAIDLVGTKDGDNVWTSYARNANGLVTKMVEGDDDSNPDNTNPTAARITYYYYGDSSFPGLVTEARRASEIKDGTCNATTTTACKRTIYDYDTDGNLSSKQETGFTYDATGSVVSYSYTTDYTYDATGRVTKIESPTFTDADSNSVRITTEFTHYTSGEFDDGYVKETKYKNGSTSYLIVTLADYDEWGNAESTEDPAGDLTCRTYDDQNFLSSERRAMNGQTACSTTHSSDIETTYTRDTWGRLTKVEHPLGNCTHYEYDSEGRLQYVKKRDNCTPTSSGHTKVHTYNIDGLLTKVEYKDASGNVRKEQEYTYHSSRRLDEAKNPVSTSYAKGWEWNDDGTLAAIDFENDLGRTEWDYDDLNREDAIRRFTSTMSYVTWDLTPGSQLDLPIEVTDPDSEDIDWVWDDLGRKVEQVNEEAGTTLYVYNASSLLVNRIEADGTADEEDTVFRYDRLGRLVEEDYENGDCGGSQSTEVEYIYDDACDTGDTCDNQDGRLANVRVIMFCDTSLGDDAFDQETWYSYDAAGRIVTEYIKDDGGRDVTQTYAYNKAGGETDVTAPSGVTMGFTYGDTSENSDTDKIKTFWRDDGSTTNYAQITGDQWEPFGPYKQVRHYNVDFSGQTVYEDFVYNEAYRHEKLVMYAGTASNEMSRIDYTEDERGRYTLRDFSNMDGVADAYYMYDDLSRVTCDSAASGSCPTPGSPTNLKSNLSFLDDGKRDEFYHYHPQYGTGDFTYEYLSGDGDKIYRIQVPGGAIPYYYNYGWDERGNREYDDHDQYGDDRRDYTYDGRNNVLTVRGKFFEGLGHLGSWHWYTMTNAYDHKNRRVFKGVWDETDDVEAQWFFYYDLQDRLIEIKHVPDITDTDTYTIYQFYWVYDRPMAYWQIDEPSSTTTRRVYFTDELKRPIEVWSWPTSGDSSVVWLVNPDLYGWDEIVNGASVFQPLRFPGQYYDEETISWATSSTPLRPGLHENRNRVYDPFVGSYLQEDPEVDDTWDAYRYVGANPVQNVDPDGRATVNIVQIVTDSHGCPIIFFPGGQGGGLSGYGCMYGSYCECPPPWEEEYRKWFQSGPGRWCTGALGSPKTCEECFECARQDGEQECDFAEEVAYNGGEGSLWVSFCDRDHQKRGDFCRPVTVFYCGSCAEPVPIPRARASSSPYQQRAP